ncbi:MAG: polyphosphate polymerase domain-containing protein [Treponema sp.]|nr:polyphosphate polymerase domain-containing protein [Treponema sp.]
MQSIFKRYEKKYIISKDQSVLIKDFLTGKMKIDRDGEYLVQNLYYDTPNWDIIRESIEKPLYKEKLRLRFYGSFEPESHGFLELKKKYNGIVYKRRIAFSLSELKNNCVKKILQNSDSQISREINYFLSRKNAAEKIYIGYQRLAYNGVDNEENLRVSFDKDIIIRDCSIKNLYSGGNYQKNDYQILDDNYQIMEIKTKNSIPVWLAVLLSKNKIYPVSFSKYGTYFTKYVLDRQDIAAKPRLKEIENAA